MNVIAFDLFLFHFTISVKNSRNAANNPCCYLRFQEDWLVYHPQITIML